MYTVHEMGDPKPIVYNSLAVAIAVSVSMSTMSGYRYQVKDYWGRLLWDTIHSPKTVSMEELY